MPTTYIYLVVMRRICFKDWGLDFGKFRPQTLHLFITISFNRLGPCFVVNRSYRYGLGTGCVYAGASRSATPHRCVYGGLDAGQDSKSMHVLGSFMYHKWMLPYAMHADHNSHAKLVAAHSPGSDALTNCAWRQVQIAKVALYDLR